MSTSNVFFLHRQTRYLGFASIWSFQELRPQPRRVLGWSAFLTGPATLRWIESYTFVCRENIYGISIPSLLFGCASIPRCRSCLYVCLSVCVIFENMLAWPYLEHSEGIKINQSRSTIARPIRRHSSSTNQEASWLDQSEGVKDWPKRSTIVRPIRRHSS